MISRMSSGSSRADSAVDPARSQNITVSWRRSADIAGRVACGVEGAAPLIWGPNDVIGAAVGAPDALAASLLPQLPQNFAPGRAWAPQDGQPVGISAPHSSQNRFPGVTSALQLGHSMMHLRWSAPRRSVQLTKRLQQHL